MTQPTLHRSWLLRGNFSPSPWGRSMSGLLEETEVSFLRFPTSTNALGGEESSTKAAEYLVAQCHVELEENEVKVVEPSVGIVMLRNWFLDMAIPGDLTLMPVRGDRVRFTDPTGNVIDTVLVAADTPEGVADHVEMRTESWQ